MFARKARRAAYECGYIDALEDLKAELFNEAEQRLRDRAPFDVGTLSEHVMDTIGALIRNPRNLT